MRHMINLDKNTPIEFQKTGFYFQSNQHHYLIECDIKEITVNCLVVIYELASIPQDEGCAEMIIKNGDKISVYDFNYFCEIDLWGKYYFPKFSPNQYQCYYDVKEISPFNWELNKEGNNNEITAMSDVMKFAIELGLKEGKIKLY